MSISILLFGLTVLTECVLVFVIIKLRQLRKDIVNLKKELALIKTKIQTLENHVVSHHQSLGVLAVKTKQLLKG